MKSGFSSLNNQAIEKYLLEHYFELATPGFAVLLTGEWGCGKTWFIEQILNRLNKKKYARFSIAGCKTTSDLNNQLFAAYGIKNAKFAKYVNGAISAGAPAFIAEKVAVAVNAGKALFIEKFIKSNAVVVIDDLERSDLPTPVLIGYINDLVEQRKCSVILIANLEKLEKKNKGFAEVKEKIIGKVYTVETEVHSAVRHFYQNMSMENLSLDDAIRCVEVVFQNTGHNIRAINYAFSDFKQLYNSSASMQKLGADDKELVIRLFLEVLIYRVGLATRVITESDMCNAVLMLNGNGARARLINRDESEDEKLFRELCNEAYRKITAYSTRVTNLWFQSNSFMVGRSIIPIELIKDFFCKGALNINLLNRSIEKAINFGKDVPEWHCLIAYEVFDDEQEFQATYDAMWQKLLTCEPMHPGDFLHLIGIYIEFSEIGFGNISIDEISKVASKYLSESNWSREVLEEVFDITTATGWSKYGYRSVEHPARINIWNELKSLKSSIVVDANTQVVLDLPLCIKQQPDSAYSLMTRFCYNEGQKGNMGLYDQAVLVHLDVPAFVEAVLSTSAATQRNICVFLSQRYTIAAHWIENLFDEVSVLKNIIDEFECQRASFAGGSLRSIQTNDLIINILQPAYVSFLAKSHELMAQKLAVAQAAALMDSGVKS